MITREARARLGLLLVSCLVAAAGNAQSVDGRMRNFDIAHYEVRLEPRLDARTIAGTAILTVRPDNDAVEAIVLNRGGLEVDAVHEESSPRIFTLEGNRLVVRLPRSRSWRERTLTIDYHGTPRSGLVFAPEREQLYTLFSTSQWMPAIDAPDSRATLRLRVIIPRTWKLAGNGREVARRNATPDTDAVEWIQDRPVPSYTFGFVAGALTDVTERASDVSLRFLAHGFSQTELRTLFGDSARMLAFFQERAGVRYPGTIYTQALVARTAGQEMAGLSVVSEEYGRAVLQDPALNSLFAHELAHQWWGNMVTCRAWTEFWLNEGFATYMAAAYREFSMGRAAYLADIEAMRGRYNEVVARGHDRSLIFSSWDRPSADDRTLVYQKGALVLHELRVLVGDTAFWSGIRLYTSTNFGKSVRTEDFRAAMEQASGKELGPFFDRWVFAATARTEVR
jgi:aminopeptidase N